jgi:hypothetical protein
MGLQLMDLSSLLRAFGRAFGARSRRGTGRRLSESRHALPDPAVSRRQAPACDQSRNQRGERLRLAAVEKGNRRLMTLL